MTSTIHPEDMPEIIEMVLKAWETKQRGVEGHIGNSQGVGSLPHEWERWAESLPVYGLLESAQQNADGTVPYNLNVGGLGVAPLA